jgi:serine/threonine protein kinase
MPGTDKAARRSGPREPADGELIADRYQLQTRLGRGGMGEVWSARDLRLHRDVAVKVFHDGSGTPAADLPDWLRREGIAAAQIVHPNVAVLYDQGVHRDRIYLVMELVPGATLGDVMRGGRLPLRTALSFAAQIAEALAAAHAARVVHRDIKPHNVLITPDGTAKVVDFGIAGFLADTRSWTIARLDTAKGSGTPEYAAPEQVLGHNADARSDLYSLGTLLYAMLAGQVPFRANDFLAVMHKKATEDAPPLPPGAGAPREVVALVAELLTRDPEHRPASARRVAARLRELLERSPRGEAQVEGEGSDSLDRKSRVEEPAAPEARKALTTEPPSGAPWTAAPLERPESAEKLKAAAKLKAQVAPAAERADEEEGSEPTERSAGDRIKKADSALLTAAAGQGAVADPDQQFEAAGPAAGGDPAGAESGSDRDQRLEPKSAKADVGRVDSGRAEPGPADPGRPESARADSGRTGPGSAAPDRTPPAQPAPPNPRPAPSAKKPAPAKSPAAKPPVWGASKEHVASPDTSAWEPLAATGATVLSAAAVMELRGRSLLPPPARSLLANPGERYVPSPSVTPVPAPAESVRGRRSVVTVLLIVLAVAVVAIGAIVLTGR